MKTGAATTENRSRNPKGGRDLPIGIMVNGTKAAEFRWPVQEFRTTGVSGTTDPNRITGRKGVISGVKMIGIRGTVPTDCVVRIIEIRAVVNRITETNRGTDPRAVAGLSPRTTKTSGTTDPSRGIVLKGTILGVRTTETSRTVVTDSAVRTTRVRAAVSGLRTIATSPAVPRVTGPKGEDPAVRTTRPMTGEKLNIPLSVRGSVATGIVNATVLTIKTTKTSGWRGVMQPKSPVPIAVRGMSLIPMLARRIRISPLGKLSGPPVWKWA